MEYTSKPTNFDDKFELLMQEAGAIVTDSSDIFKRLDRAQYSKQKHLMLPGVNLPKDYLSSPEPRMKIY